MTIGYEKLPPGRYRLRAGASSYPDTAVFRLTGPAGLWWRIEATADPSLLALLDDDHTDTSVRARLMAVLAEATPSIIAEMVDNEQLPTDTNVWVTFDDTHHGLAHAINSDRPLEPPDELELVATFARQPRPAAPPRRGNGQRRRSRNRKGRR